MVEGERTSGGRYVKHGTRAFELPPSAIVATAKADLEKRARNTAFAAWIENPSQNPAVPNMIGYERYAFRAAHVRRADSVSALISIALSWARKHRDKPLKSRSAELLYGDIPALEKARRLALVKEG